MNELPIPKAEPTAEDARRKRLVNGIVIAALLVVGLAGTLMMFESVYAPGPPVAAKRSQPPAAGAKPESAAAAGTASPVAQAGEGQYALQVGAFSDVANAEDLRARLEKLGVPSSISVEARVQVGPFRTREEVDAARAKLKELGVYGSQLVTLKK